MTKRTKSDAPQATRRARRRIGAAALVTSAALAVGVVAVTSGGAGADEPLPQAAAMAAAPSKAGIEQFTSRPDLKPTAVRFGKRDRTTDSGYIFAAPKSSTGKELTLAGPMIIAPDGRLVWFKHVKGGAYTFRAQTYEGKPVLTWWQGDVRRGYGFGEAVIYDQNYKRIATVKTGKGQKADLHEFVITPQNTALLIAYKPIRGDLRSVKGGTRNDLIMDNVVQEVDIKTGKVLLDWHIADSIAPSESYHAVPNDPELPYDYAHLNSVEIGSDGNLLVSARATHAVYRINRKTGKLMDRIGGKKSDYKMGRGSRTAYQHDARQVNATQMSLYDNNAEERTTPISKHQTRGVILNIDEEKKTVTLASEIHHPERVWQAASQGNMQVLPNGNRFFGWGGSVPYFTEVDPDGKAVLEGRYLKKGIDSYRAFRAPWVGTPTEKPAVAARRSGAATVVSMSWNGATEVKTWRIKSGPTATSTVALATVPFSGFETTMRAATTQPFVQVEALNAAGDVLGTSAAVRSKS
jgi:hypothetical protein